MAQLPATDQADAKLRWRDYRPGPAMLVTAAFIGPGTVTAASLAGAASGFALLWALVFAIFGAIILQNMAGRIGIVRQLGLAEAILLQMPGKGLKLAMAGLILAALVVGNAAYEGGNLGGAVAGAQLLLPDTMGDKRYLIIAIAILAATFFLLGGRKMLTGLLTILVVMMSIAFVAAALSGGIDVAAMAKGLIPSLPDGSTLTAIALIGTTIVPYNLFLHAALTRDKWSVRGGLDSLAQRRAISAMERDTGIAISLGGLISIAILATAANFVFTRSLSIASPADMAMQIAPVTGDWALLTIGTGLFAAGLTSAITAPLATALIVQELFRVFSGDGSRYLRSIYYMVGLAIITSGAIVGFADISLLTLIVTAQIANGLLLPIVAILLYRLAFSDNDSVQIHWSKRLPALTIIGVTLLLSGRQLFLLMAG